ncbi:myb-like transcription factor family protein [Euphorbia peplus]|nr:myb-like transcription factor family protein [Euphorbia peplus]
MDYAEEEKMKRCHEYVRALEEERRKIQVFQRELPLCLELVTQAIEASKKEISGTTTEYVPAQSEECSEQTHSSEETRPMVLEEFMPIKRTNSSSHNDNENDDDEDEEDDDEELHSHKRINKEKQNDHKKKSEWLKSVQLWSNQSSDLPTNEVVPRKALVTEVKRNGGAFQPFHKEKTIPAKSNQIVTGIPASSTSSTAETVTVSGTSGGGDGDGSRKKSSEEKDSNKKQRRCWSPELHRRFLHALQQLGGSHTATPKQIRELMKVDGLTNDEVKSHLQKYRLHTRRPASTVHNNHNNTQAPQFVVVGGIWVPPPDYAASTGEKPANTLYAPVAAPPVTNKSEEGNSIHNECRLVRSSSPSTSSSEHTTNSPL